MTRASHGRHEAAFTVIQALGLNRNTPRKKIRDLDLRTMRTIR
jgi:DNA-binding protein Fis